MASLLDEDLCASNESDFSDIFTAPSTTNSSDLDEIVTVVDNDANQQPSNENQVTTVKKKRGRPKKSEADVANNKSKSKDENSASKDDKKTRNKRISIDDFPFEAIKLIFEQYSVRPAAEIACEIGYQEEHVHKVVNRLAELFSMAISTGDLSQEEYESDILPKLREFRELSNFEEFVKTKIKSIKDK